MWFLMASARGVLAGLVLATTLLALPMRDATAASVEQVPVELVFSAQIASEPLVCGKTYHSVGKTNASMFLQDFRIYVSAVRLVLKDGKEVPVTLTPDAVWQNEQVALLDFENASGNCNGNAATNDRVRGVVPAGEYRGVVFEIGVPFALNHQDPTLAAAPLNYSAMTWPWSIGYKFTGIDFDTAPTRTALTPESAGKPAGGAPQTTGMPRSGMMGMHGPTSATGFSVHLGSMECVSSGPRSPPPAPCAFPNRPSFRFESFDPAKQRLVLDLARLLADTDVTVNASDSSSGCMSSTKDDDCVGIMDRLGLPFRGKPSSGQRFVRVEAR